ncbi:hypothetical protein HDU76_006169, partial [Blyttiomyces sp. JEL0837]
MSSSSGSPPPVPTTNNEEPVHSPTTTKPPASSSSSSSSPTSSKPLQSPTSTKSRTNNNNKTTPSPTQAKPTTTSSPTHSTVPPASEKEPDAGAGADTAMIIETEATSNDNTIGSPPAKVVSPTVEKVEPTETTTTTATVNSNTIPEDNSEPTPMAVDEPLVTSTSIPATGRSGTPPSVAAGNSIGEEKKEIKEKTSTSPVTQSLSTSSGSKRSGSPAVFKEKEDKVDKPVKAEKAERGEREKETKEREREKEKEKGRDRDRERGERERDRDKDREREKEREKEKEKDKLGKKRGVGGVSKKNGASNGSSSHLPGANDMDVDRPYTPTASSSTNNATNSSKDTAAQAALLSGNYKMNFNEVDEKCLRKYRRLHKVKSGNGGNDGVISREESVAAVTKHFHSSDINEKDVCYGKCHQNCHTHKEI